MNTYFIAEIGSNHNHDWGRCEKLIESAAECGFNAVKFQYGLGQTFHPSIQREVRDFPMAWMERIGQMTRKLGIEFGCTPVLIEDYGAFRDTDWLKIGSYELPQVHLWHRHIYAIKFLSTGMATYYEIEQALRHFKVTGGVAYQDPLRQPTLMHTVSQYPAGRGDTIAAEVKRLAQFGCPVGYSDHTVQPNAIYEALGGGAVAVEAHFDLDGTGAEAGHSWRPEPIGEVIDRVNPDWRERRWRRDVDGYRPMRWAR